VSAPIADSTLSLCVSGEVLNLLDSCFERKEITFGGQEIAIELHCAFKTLKTESDFLEALSCLDTIKTHLQVLDPELGIGGLLVVFSLAKVTDHGHDGIGGLFDDCGKGHRRVFVVVLVLVLLVLLLGGWWRDGGLCGSKCNCVVWWNGARLSPRGLMGKAAAINLTLDAVFEVGVTVSARSQLFAGSVVRGDRFPTQGQLNCSIAHDEMLQKDLLASANETALGASERAVVMNREVRLHVRLGREDGDGTVCQALAALPGGSGGVVVGHCGYDRCLYDCTVSRVKQDYQMRGVLTERSC